MRAVAAYSPSSPRARGVWCCTRHTRLQGTRIVPVPRMGRASTRDTTMAHRGAYWMPRIRNPTVSSRQVTDSSFSWAISHCPAVARSRARKSMASRKGGRESCSRSQMRIAGSLAEMRKAASTAVPTPRALSGSRVSTPPARASARRVRASSMAAPPENS